MSEMNLINDTIVKDIVDKIHGIDVGTITTSIYRSRIVEVDVTRTDTQRFDRVWLENGEGI
jgi:hypothetical protein